jgi:phenylpyruvate tautomerase PptA (4-oxalocrotonate tautomerase family)
MPRVQITLPTGVARPAARQALDNVIATLTTVLESSVEATSAWVNEVDRELWTAPGPFVHIMLLSGRPTSLMQHLIREVTAGVAHALGCDPAIVRVVVTDENPDLWGIGGIPATVVRAEQLAARSRKNR